MDDILRLRGRRNECEALDRLVANVRAGQSRVLVLRGEAGAGKTALLEYLVQRAPGCRIVRAEGAEPEMEMAFAGLHQLCAPFLDRLGRLPDPQRDALERAFSLRDGSPPDRFAVGLAAMSLLSEVAGDQPLVCVVDDTQWLDRASEHVLAFVARHLEAASVALVFAVRQPGGEQDLSGLPEVLGTSDRRRADRVLRAGAVLPSARPGRGLRGGLAAAASARPPRPRGRHRPGRRSRSPRLAPRAGRTRTG